MDVEHNEPPTDDEASPGGSGAAGDDAGAVRARARALVVQQINQATPGRMTLHYKARDVNVDVPGDVALRTMVVFRRNRIDGLDDPVDLDSTLALCPAGAFGLKGLLAVTWEPGPDAEGVIGNDLLDSLAIINRAPAHRSRDGADRSPSADEDPGRAGA